MNLNNNLWICFLGVLLLILEQKNDYVRFHAWQVKYPYLLKFNQFILSNNTKFDLNDYSLI